MPVLRIDRPDAIVRRAIRIQNRNQPTGPQLRLYIIIRQLDDPEVLQRRIDQRCAAVAAEIAFHPDVAGGSFFLKPPIAQSALQTVVAVKFGQGVRGSVRGKVFGCRAGVMPARGQPLCHHGAVFQLSQPDCEIVAFRYKIEQLIGQPEVDLKIRIAPHEVVDQRRDAVLAICHRGCKVQPSLGALMQIGDRALGFGQPIKHLPAMVVIHLTRLGDRDLARGAVEQLGVQSRLKCADLAADLSRRNTQAVGSSCKALGFSDGHKF